jgi:hypothetical protein
LLVGMQVFIHFVSIFKFYSRLKRFRFEIINFINKSIKFYPILRDSINFKIDHKFVRILILKLIFVDLTAISIKIASEKKSLGLMGIFKVFLAAVFGNFLNLNNMHLIYLRSLLSCIHQRLQEIGSSWNFTKR